MKGFISAIGGTLIVLMTVVFAVLIAVFAFVAITKPFDFVGKSPQSDSIDFVAENNRALNILGVLTLAKMDDRNMLEHSTEVAVSSVKNASSQNLGPFLGTFLAYYSKNDDKHISVSIQRNNTQLFFYDNTVKKCGDDLSGVCVDLLRTVSGVIEINSDCGKGRKNIDASLYTNSANKCSFGNCCVENEVGGIYLDSDVVMCGVADNTGAKKGICDSPTADQCAQGRVKVPEVNNECSRNGGQVCCVAVQNVNAIERSGVVSTTEMPLLFKDKILGTLEVTVQ